MINLKNDQKTPNKLIFMIWIMLIR
jgi:hypothetical protein